MYYGGHSCLILDIILHNCINDAFFLIRVTTFFDILHKDNIFVPIKLANLFIGLNDRMIYYILEFILDYFCAPGLSLQQAECSPPITCANWQSIFEREWPSSLEEGSSSNRKKPSVPPQFFNGIITLMNEYILYFIR